MISESTVILGLAYGDEGKGKIVLNEAKSGKYNCCLRFNGSANAGHTIYLNGNKIITHIIPTGVLFGLQGIIGPGCVVNERMFFEELREIEKHVPNVRDLVKIAYNAHVVQEKHIEEEISENKIGTTKRGVGPAYRDKYARTGKRAENCESLKPFLIDVYEEFYGKLTRMNLLCEGAQAMGLDIDFGNYPYVTSSHCGIGSVINNGVNFKSIKKIHGVIKGYTTYVGSRKFQNPDDSMLDKICEIGQEFGATTGRKRQVNYLDLNMIKKFAEMNSVNELHVNKMDILRELDCWKVILNGSIVNCKTENNFKEMIKNYVFHKVQYYYTPE